MMKMTAPVVNEYADATPNQLKDFTVAPPPR
jgi:hypothetical protein